MEEKKVCAKCGSENIWIDAKLRWNGKEWYIDDMFPEDAWCHDCESLTEVVESKD